MKIKSPYFIILALLAFIGILQAATLTYSPAAPQTGDTEQVINHKAAVAATTTAENTGGGSFVNITTATTTAVKASAGVIERLIVNSAGAGSTLVLYNNTAGSGAKIGTFTTAIQGSIEINAAFGTGLTAVSASGTPADITIVYR